MLWLLFSSFWQLYIESKRTLKLSSYSDYCFVHPPFLHFQCAWLSMIPLLLFSFDFYLQVVSWLKPKMRWSSGVFCVYVGKLVQMEIVNKNGYCHAYIQVIYRHIHNNAFFFYSGQLNICEEGCCTNAVRNKHKEKPN